MFAFLSLYPRLILKLIGRVSGMYRILGTYRLEHEFMATFLGKSCA